jgi:hypothetical protein
MTDRDRQRQRLAELHAEWEAAGDSEPRQLSTFLLDNGVSVVLPPEPPIGARGTVTLINRAQYPALRAEGGYVYVDEGGNHGYVSAVHSTFVPDPEPLTVETVQDIQQAIESTSFSSAEQARYVGQRLLPYVAGGAR